MENGDKRSEEKEKEKEQGRNGIRGKTAGERWWFVPRDFARASFNSNDAHRGDKQYRTVPK